jgi:hypothetical protein
MCAFDENGIGGPGADDRRRAAYDAAAEIARKKMERDAPEGAEALKRVDESDIVVVEGQFDSVERVLRALELPFSTVSTGQVERLRLRPEQLLVVNCPGNISSTAVPVIRDFVEAGGTLFTTDWALKHVVEPCFPGTVAYNGRATADDVVRIEVLRPEHRFLAGVLEEGDDPLWWLEGSSYPIRIVDPEKVEVLITSRELEEKYGEAPVAVTFPWGEGEVLHMISHYYLQRAELRTARHKMAGADFVSAKGVDLSAEKAAFMDEMSRGEMEAAYSSSRLMANIVAEKKRGRGPKRPD